jgi:RHS repeat-associated protein
VADPRVEHTLNVKVDEYGNVLESAKVAYARRTPDPGLPQAARTAQARPLVTYTQTEMTDDAIAAAHHRLRVAARATDYEITGLSMPGPIFTLADFDRPAFSVLTSSTEIPNHQDDSLPPPGTVFRRMIARKETLYYDANLTGAAALRHLEPHGLPFESYELAYPAGLLTDVFGANATSAVMAEARYVHRGDADWWVPSGRWEYLAAGEAAAAARARFFARVAQVGASGSRTTIGYFGDYFLLQDEVVDAAGNHTRVAEFDLRALRPRRLEDPNDNVSEVLLDELGWVKATALRGKGGEADDIGALTSQASPADDAVIAQLFAAPSSVEVAAAAAQLLGSASSRHVHDLDRYRASGGALPPASATVVRERHAAVDAASPLQVSFEYPNGSGQVEMTKVQAEPGRATSTTIAPNGSVTLAAVDTAALVPPRLRWLGTGRKVVNNKGNVVKEYEPFFSVTHEFETEKQLVAAGVTRIHFYDPIDRLVRVDQPDGSFSRTTYGPWAVVEEDRNDTVLESRWYDERINRRIDVKLVAAGKDPVREAAAAAQAAEHANTPLTRHLDPLGRPAVETQHAGADSGGQPLLFHTAFRRDLSGRTLAVTNPRGIRTVAYRRDMRGALARCDSPDSGRRLTLGNVMGNPVRAWDDRSHELVFTYDALHRPLAKRVRGGDGPQALDNVFELNVYGEGRPGDKAANLRMKIALQYDTAGRTEHLGYDFKGNLLAASRRFATEYRAVVDWSGPNPAARLDAETFDSACSYDALDRITARTVPDGSVHTPTYNAANLLETVTVTQDGTSELVVKNIDYDEHGLRQRIVFGNDVTTDYVHDAETFRLVRLTTRRGGPALQDLGHTYDPAGNLTHLVDACVPTVWFANAMVTGESTYRYDPLYRLTEATGREHAGQMGFGATDNVSDAANLGQYAATDVLAWQTYTERYQYDATGNLKQLAHTAPATPGWTRDYAHAPDSDRLLSTTVGASTYSYSHHPRHGYVASMPHLSLMRWSFKDELQAVATQVVNAGVPETTWHVYDGDGKRVRKVTDRSAPTQDAATRRFERYTVDGTEIEREYDAAGAVTAQRRTLHVMDDQDRIASIETDDPPGGPPGPRLTRYQGLDRLGSSSLETDAAGRAISYEVYHPFGTTAYQAVEKTIVAAAKRFRYTGMERDSESGLEYHGARYYAPWLGRWLAPDTHADRLDGNRYAYAKNNPVANRDRNGLFEEPVHGITTFRLAVAAGFTVEEAATIAVETAGMDHDHEHWPGGGFSFVTQVLLGRTQRYHFPSQEQAKADVDADIAGGARDLTQFAQHLHTLEDVGFTDAAGPHDRSNSRIFADITGTGTVALFAAGAMVGALTGLFNGAGSTGAAVATGILLGLGALLFVAFLFVAGIGHPTYTTEKGHLSTSFSHVADRASEDPRANTDELWRIYGELKRARAARYGSEGTPDDAAALAAIQDVVTAEDSCAMSNLVNLEVTDSRGGRMSYAQALARRSHDSWTPQDIDVTFTSGETWTYRASPAQQVCPVPATR